MLSGCAGRDGRSKAYNPYVYGADSPEQHAQRLVWAGDFEQAITVLEEYGYICKGAERYTLLGRSYLQTGAYEEAAEAYRTAFAMPAFWDDRTWVDRDISVRFLGDPDIAMCFAAAFDADHIRAGKFMRAAEAMLRIGDNEGTLRMCEGMCDCGLAADPHMLMARGEAHFQLRRFGDARRDFRRALESLDEEHARKRLREIEDVE